MKNLLSLKQIFFLKEGLLSHSIYDFFVMVFEYFLDDVIHTTIMKEIYAAVNKNPSRLRGRGVDASQTLFYLKRRPHGS